MTARCQVMLCQQPALGAVRVACLVQGMPQVREVHSCRPCSDSIAEALHLGHNLALTPDGNIYLADLANLYRPLR